MHRRTSFRKKYSREVLNQGVAICRQCQDGIHRFYTEMELARQFYSLSLLQQDEKLARYFEWVGKQTIRV